MSFAQFTHRESLRDIESGGPVHPTPIYEKLIAQGAVFAETFGWERAKWFDMQGEGKRYSFRRNNSFDNVAEECRAVRERVGLLDLTCFAKYEISGADAETFLNRVCANRIPQREGGVALVHMLTELGGKHLVERYAVLIITIGAGIRSGQKLVRIRVAVHPTHSRVGQTGEYR